MSAPTTTLGVDDDDLVTGDAVALRLPAASPGVRILSGLLDVLAYGAVLVGALVAVDGLLQGVDEALGAAITLTTVVLVVVGLPLLVETTTRGRSLGRLVTGTTIVRTDGGPVSPRQSLTRALVGFVEIWMTTGAVALVAVACSRRGQRLGDLAAGTCCVRDRFALRLPPPVQPVPALEPWVRSADIGPVPDDLARAARQLLLRRDTLVPAARADLRARLGAAMAPLVSPPPPADAPVEDVLQAVLAERSRRDGERLTRDAALRERLHLG